MQIHYLLVVFLAYGQLCFAADLPGSGDHPLVPRYPGSEICNAESSAYDAYDMVVGPATSRDDIPTQAVEGRVTRNMYVLKDEDRSTLEVMRNYEIALKDAGFAEIYSCQEHECVEGAEYKTYFFTRANPNLQRRCRVPEPSSWIDREPLPRYFSARLERPVEGDVEVAVTVAAWKTQGGQGPRYVYVQADVVEQEAMAIGMELKLAEDMNEDISSSGRAVLYGVQFDTDSTQIKAESGPTLTEIAKLMGSRPQLNLLVVGHTDNQGSLEYNLDLSTRRAEAVVDALVDNHGIARSRLEGHGVGYLAPEASNQTEEGRTLNRRVELVED